MMRKSVCAYEACSILSRWMKSKKAEVASATLKVLHLDQIIRCHEAGVSHATVVFTVHAGKFL
jgi:hypothetical protein